jgi:hypothetical protein
VVIGVGKAALVSPASVQVVANRWMVVTSR